MLQETGLAPGLIGATVRELEKTQDESGRNSLSRHKHFFPKTIGSWGRELDLLTWL